MLHLSDIHIDFAYKPGSDADCFQPLCCREGAPREYTISVRDCRESTLISSSWSHWCWFLVRTLNSFTAIARSDRLGVTTEIATCHSGRLKLFFNVPPNWKRCSVKHSSFFLRRIVGACLFDKVDFIYYTGDLPPHNVWNQSRADQIYAIKTINQLLANIFPNKTFYSAVGNHEAGKNII